jgi:hypothetical protein
MTVIIDPQGQNTGVAKSLQDAGDAMFAHGAERELRRQRIAQAQRKANELAAYQDAYRRNDPVEMGAHAIGAGADGESVARYALARRALASGENFNDPYLATAALGAGVPFANTAPGAREAAAARAPVANSPPLAVTPQRPPAAAPPIAAPPRLPQTPATPIVMPQRQSPPDALGGGGAPGLAPDAAPLEDTPEARVMKALADRRRRDQGLDAADPAIIDAQPAPGL